MQTPFGEIRVLDAHAHFFSDRFFRTLAGQMPDPPAEGQIYQTIGEKIEWEFPEKDPVSLAHKWVAEMDKQSLDRMALIASVPNDEKSIAAVATVRTAATTHRPFPPDSQIATVARRPAPTPVCEAMTQCPTPRMRRLP